MAALAPIRIAVRRILSRGPDRILEPTEKAVVLFILVVGAVGFGRPRVLMQYRRLVAEQASFDDALALEA